jgi:hypothetical protein
MVNCASAPGGQQGERLLLGEVRGVFGRLGQAEGCHLGCWWTGAVSAAGLVQAVPGLDIPWVISSCAVRLFVSFCLGLYSTKTTLGCLTINKKNGAKVLYGFSFIGKLQ